MSLKVLQLLLQKVSSIAFYNFSIIASLSLSPSFCSLSIASHALQRQNAENWKKIFPEKE
jgi:hypothetical protein